MKTDRVIKLLEARGITDTKEQDRFLSPDWDRDTHDPFLMKDMSKAVERLKKAIENNEKIVIYSDYDCDGIPGGVVLHDFFRKLNYANFTNYIPHRHNEGYGVHTHAIDKFVKDKVSLMITVDLGITNLEEIRAAQAGGIDVILTDHHLPLRDVSGAQILPRAYAVINTKRDDCNYPEKMLCGCATAWKLAHAFLVKYRDEYKVPAGYEKWWLDMVGISTVADMVPLTGENRVLATYGLKVLRKSKRPGLQKILSNAKIKMNILNESDIGFGIAPRLNAAGRMGDPIEAFNALLDEDEALIYAERLEKHNSDRKKDTLQANQSIDWESLKDKNVIVIGDKSWSPGILGLIASKIVDVTGKTAFVWGVGEESGVAKGSVRAGSDGANVVQLMSSCASTLKHFGGHEQAGGFALNLDILSEFEEKLSANYEIQKDSFVKGQTAKVADFRVTASEANMQLLKEFSIMAPFGIGNPQPILSLNGKCLSVRNFGASGQHLELNIEGLSCIKFNVDASEKDRLINAREWLGYIEKDTYRFGIKFRLI